MSLKVWLLVLVLFLIMAISGIVSGKTTDDTSLGLGDLAWEVSDLYIPVPGISTARVFTEHGLPKSMPWGYDPVWDDLGPAFISDGLKSAELAATLAGSVYWAGIAAIAGFQSNMYDRYGGYSYKPSTSDSSGGKTTDLKAKLTQQGIGTPLLPPPTSEMPSDGSNGGSGTLFGTGSGSSGVVGKWVFVKDIGGWPTGEGPMTIEYIIFFNRDGSTYVPEQHYIKWGWSFDFPEGRGTWTQNGNIVSWNHGSSTCDECYPTTGTIDINRMSGSINGLSWNAKKVEEIAGVGPLVDEGQNGGGGW
jgi:hypothetical protein